MQVTPQTKAALVATIGETPTHTILALQWRLEAKKCYSKEDIEDFMSELIARSLQLINNPPELETALLSTYLITTIRNLANNLLGNYWRRRKTFIVASTITPKVSRREGLDDVEDDCLTDFLENFPEENAKDIPTSCDARLLRDAITSLSSSVDRAIVADILKGYRPTNACERHGSPRNYFGRSLLVTLREKVCNENLSSLSDRSERKMG